MAVLDHTLASLAFRNRLLTLSVATTGAVSLSATTSGYARAAGSFVTDGIAPGMEFLAAGFGANGYRVAIGVTPTLITVAPNTLTAESAASGRSLVVGVPQKKMWDNVIFEPKGEQPYVDGEFVPGTARVLTARAQSGTVEETGLYLVRWFGLSKWGTAPMRKPVDAIRALFAPGTSLTAGSVLITVRGDIAPSASRITRIDGGWSVITTTIGWRAHVINSIS